VREALDELLRCANAIVGADPSDSESAEAFTMFDLARVKARKCLALDAAAPAAEPVAWQYQDTHWDNERWHVCAEKPNETRGRKIRPLYLAPPLQAPAHSDAVRELEPWRSELEEITSHLGAAIMQSTDSDDKIIMDHVKAAHEIAKIIRRKA
jgi:hypothetical protein